MSTIMERAENFTTRPDNKGMILLVGNIYLHPNDFDYVTIFYHFDNFICNKIEVYGTKDQLSILWDSLIKENCINNACMFDENKRILYLLKLNEQCYIKPNIQGNYILTIETK